MNKLSIMTNAVIAKIYLIYTENEYLKLLTSLVRCARFHCFHGNRKCRTKYWGCASLISFKLADKINTGENNPVLFVPIQ